MMYTVTFSGNLTQAESALVKRGAIQIAALLAAKSLAAGSSSTTVTPNTHGISSWSMPAVMSGTPLTRGYCGCCPTTSTPVSPMP